MIRIRKNADFQTVYRHGSSKADKYIVLYRMENGTGESRFGVSVSKKVGNSVVRHQIKRRLKEIWRLNRKNEQEGFDVIAIARGPAAKADYRILEKSLLRLLERSETVREIP